MNMNNNKSKLSPEQQAIVDFYDDYKTIITNQERFISFDKLIASLPEKRHTEVGILAKNEAFRQLRGIYVWYPDNMLNNIKFSVNRFKTTKRLYHFMLLGYHILRFLGYMLTAPCRIFTIKSMLECSK